MQFIRLAYGNFLRKIVKVPVHPLFGLKNVYLSFCLRILIFDMVSLIYFDKVFDELYSRNEENSVFVKFFMLGRNIM